MTHRQAQKQALALKTNRGKDYRPVDTGDGWKVVRVGSLEWRKWK
jgi:hypothetical protein